MKNISIIGLGKLGLCFALTLEKAGYNVLGCDIDESYVKSINDKTLKSPEEGVEEHLLQSVNLKATTDMGKTLNFSDIIFVIVATPSLENGRYNHTQVDSVVDKLISLGKSEKQKHFVICCTTMPQYCDSVHEKLKDYNYSVSYNPEFIAQGTILRDQLKPDMVLIGEANKSAGDLLEEIYKKHTISNPRICRMSRIEAEICKISLNCFLTTKISFANMIGDIVLKSGGNPDSVLEAIGSDSRVGLKYLNYGFGYGGPCFPRDNRALAIYASDLNRPAPISLATDSMNKIHLDFQIEQFTSVSSIEEQVIIDSVTYKPGTVIIEESQQLAYAVGIARNGYNVLIREKEAVVKQLTKTYGDLFTYEIRD
tara:strand:- start:3735 stop:4838 length:1104 start_codon:yes stop_codon:yes gene_type:complete